MPIVVAPAALRSGESVFVQIMSCRFRVGGKFRVFDAKQDWLHLIAINVHLGIVGDAR